MFSQIVAEGLGVELLCGHIAFFFCDWKSLQAVPESVLWVGPQQGLLATNKYTKAYTVAEMFELV